MKIALITDQHFGARSDNIEFDNFFKKFYQECFFPELKKRDIKKIVCLGDTFDRRKYINFNTLKSCKQYYFDEIAKMGIHLTMLVGNHDVMYKNTNLVNSPSLTLSEYKNIEIIQSPAEIQIDGTKILMLPWICADNYHETMRMIQNTTADICFGHLELAGFAMYKGQIMEEGFDPKIFQKFDLVFSGHFHHKSHGRNIDYLGNPYEITWSDYDDPRGFHIFDTSTRELEFIRNPFNMFYKVVYDDSNGDMDTSIVDGDLSMLKDSYCKVVIKNKDNPVLFDMFIDKVEKMSPIEIQLIDETLQMSLVNESGLVDAAEDTMTILSNYCQQLDVKVEKHKLESLLRSLYNEAVNLESV